MKYPQSSIPNYWSVFCVVLSPVFQVIHPPVCQFSGKQGGRRMPTKSTQIPSASPSTSPLRAPLKAPLRALCKPPKPMKFHSCTCRAWYATLRFMLFSDAERGAERRVSILPKRTTCTAALLLCTLHSALCALCTVCTVCTLCTVQLNSEL